MEDYFIMSMKRRSGIGGRKLALAVIDGGTETAGYAKDVRKGVQFGKRSYVGRLGCPLGEKSKPYL
jgi:hypothetical protein